MPARLKEYSIGMLALCAAVAVGYGYALQFESGVFQPLVF